MKCVGVASSDQRGFGVAAGHAYINEKFDDESKHDVSKLCQEFICRRKPFISNSVKFTSNDVKLS